MEYQLKLNEKYTPAFHCISTFEGTSYQNSKDELPVSLFLSFYHNFLELLKKDFCHKCSYFNGLAQTPDPLNSQNPLSITEVYCLCCFRSFIFIVVPQKSKILKLLELKPILRVLKK